MTFHHLFSFSKYYFVFLKLFVQISTCLIFCSPIFWDSQKDKRKAFSLLVPSCCRHAVETSFPPALADLWYC